MTPYRHRYISEKKAQWKTSITKDTQDGLTPATSAMICDKLSATQLRAELSTKGLNYPDNKRGSAENKKAAVRLLRQTIRNVCPMSKHMSKSLNEQETQTPHNNTVEDYNSLSPLADSEAQEKINQLKIQLMKLETENGKLLSFLDNIPGTYVEINKDCVGITRGTFIDIVDKLSITQVECELNARGVDMPKFKSKANENKKEAIKLLKHIAIAQDTDDEGNVFPTHKQVDNERSHNSSIPVTNLGCKSDYVATETTLKLNDNLVTYSTGSQTSLTPIKSRKQPKAGTDAVNQTNMAIAILPNVSESLNSEGECSQHTQELLMGKIAAQLELTDQKVSELLKISKKGTGPHEDLEVHQTDTPRPDNGNHSSVSGRAHDDTDDDDYHSATDTCNWETSGLPNHPIEQGNSSRKYRERTPLSKDPSSSKIYKQDQRLLLITDSHAEFINEKFSSRIESKLLLVNGAKSSTNSDFKRKVIKEAKIDHYVIDIGTSDNICNEDEANLNINIIEDLVRYISQRSNPKASITLSIPITATYSSQIILASGYKKIRMSNEGRKVEVVENTSLYDQHRNTLKVKFADNSTRLHLIRLANTKKSLLRNQSFIPKKRPNTKSKTRIFTSRQHRQST